MSRYCPAVLLVLVIAFPVSAAADSAELARIAEKIRSGEIDVGKEYSVREKTGRFHIIHADKLMMDCANCHYGTEYRADFLIIGKQKPYPPRAKGQYERSACVGCHQTGGIATQWYNGSTKK